MKIIIIFTFCCDNLWKSKFMALVKPGKLGGIFFSYFVATLFNFCQFYMKLCGFDAVGWMTGRASSL